MTIHASAPGKLVLLGEYAVLAGTNALVAAVDRRVRVRLEAGDGPARITATQLGLHEAPVGGPSTELVAAALGDFSGHVVVDTGSFYQDGQKLGLGSSAAICVALSAALGATDAERALAVHRNVQGGGSGVDVVAAQRGGVLRFDSRRRTGSPFSLPEDLAIIPIWTGRSASTPRMVQKVLYSGASLSRLADATDEGLAATSAREFMDAVHEFHEGLRELQEASGAPILEGGHVPIGDVVRASGAVYKPSGAGGGDLGLAFCENDQAWELAEELAAQGITTCQLRLGEPGVEVWR